MPFEDSVSQWIENLKQGGPEAASRLWNRYYLRLVGLRKKLGATSRRVADEDDVVVDAFASFCAAAQKGRFPSLKDRHDLWHMIVRITERKAYDYLRGQMRKKRGSGKVLGESVFLNANDSLGNDGLEMHAGLSPSPEFAVFAAESMRELLTCLNDALRDIALLKLEGYNNAEIASKLDCSVPTVERRLNLIRKIWTEYLKTVDSE